MIKIGQVGVGAWGQNLLRSFLSLDECWLKVCCDQNIEVLKNLKQRYKREITTTQDFNDLLQDPQLDAIVIAAPAVLHFQLAEQALQAGKHVFVEKPLCLNVQDGQNLLEAAQKNKKILMVGHLLLHHPAVKKLKKIIDNGELGNIHYIYSTRVNLGKVRKEENVLWSLTAHDISVALFLLGQRPVEVTAKGAFYLRGGIEDIVFVTITFANRTIAHIHASWLDPHKIRKFTVVGDKKMAVFDDMQPIEKLRIHDKGFDRKRDFKTYEEFLSIRDGDIYIPKVEVSEPLRLQCEHFIECIKENKEPLANASSGLEVLHILQAAQESLQNNGIPIKLSDYQAKLNSGEEKPQPLRI